MFFIIFWLIYGKLPAIVSTNHVAKGDENMSMMAILFIIQLFIHLVANTNVIRKTALSSAEVFKEDRMLSVLWGTHFEWKIVEFIMEIKFNFYAQTPCRDKIVSRFIN